MKVFDINEYKAKKDELTKIDIVTTDSITLNEMLGGGLRTSNLIVLQAPSGIGKTTFMMRLFNNTILQKKKVAYLSIGEENEIEIAERISCMFKSLEYDKFTATRNEEESQKVEEYLESHSDDYYICYSDDPFEWKKVSNGKGEKLIRDIDIFFEEIKKRNINFVFIDYVGAVIAPGRETLYSYLTRVCSDLKNIATDENLMIFTAMQTNKQLKFESRQKEFDFESMDETFMADSIGPARKATICMTLCNTPVPGMYYLNVFKNRLNGKKGLITLKMKPRNYAWDEMFGKDGF